MMVASCTPSISGSATSPSPISKYFPSSPVFPNFSSSNRKPFQPSTRSLVVQSVEGEISEENGAKPLARRLILLRHADSSWGDPSLRDHDRPLSKVGRADAINVSRKLQQMGWIPELILSSDAARTRETLKIMQEQVRGFLDAEVYLIPSFYSIAAMDGQTAEHLQQAICEYSRDEIFTVMCMGHNRGWEEAASMFSGSAVELKTCNAALLEAMGKSWEETPACSWHPNLGMKEKPNIDRVKTPYFGCLWRDTNVEECSLVVIGIFPTGNYALRLYHGY